MKKVVIIALSFILALFLLIACGNKNSNVNTSEVTQAENEFKEFQWPDSEIACLLPVPESNIGRIVWEASYGFVIYVSETAKENYDVYVNECKEMGFTVDYEKGDDYYYADNETGYHLSLNYEGEDIMRVRIDEPEVAETSAEPELAETAPSWKTESCYGITFQIYSSWEKDLLDYGQYTYSPPNPELNGDVGISCQWLEQQTGNVSIEEARAVLDDIITRLMENYDNEEEISRSYFYVGDKHAIRVVFYIDDDDVHWRLDIVLVLFEDGLTTLYSITPTEYESLYNNTLGTTLDSLELVQQPNQSQAETSVFSPQDVSDETIKSIETYNDYLKMYEMIILDFFADYEEVIKGTALYSEKSFAELKSTYEDSFQQQKDMYGAMGNTKIIGKDELVKFLIDYRDSLKEYVESLKESIG